MQKIKVNVVMANRNSRKLIFSMRPRENEEEVEKKRNLMAKLRVGDVVKCCIKKITYFGIFCEVLYIFFIVTSFLIDCCWNLNVLLKQLEGVPALIHQSEVSWDATLDPASYFKIGQVLSWNRVDSAQKWNCLTNVFFCCWCYKIVEAKVHQLDFALERIFLSLKEITVSEREICVKFYSFNR